MQFTIVSPFLNVRFSSINWEICIPTQQSRRMKNVINANLYFVFDFIITSELLHLVLSLLQFLTELIFATLFENSSNMWKITNDQKILEENNLTLMGEKNVITKEKGDEWQLCKLQLFKCVIFHVDKSG